MPVTAVLPTQLDTYTQGLRQCVLDSLYDSCCVADVLNELDTRFPGLRFRVIDEHGRIRRHMAIFVGETMVHGIDAAVPAGGRVQIVGALSGG